MPGDHALDSVEIYDAATGRWSTGAALGEARTHATTTVLDDGSVLIAGGTVGGAPFYIDNIKVSDYTPAELQAVPDGVEIFR